ncbi:hypothetical protein [Planomicrobium sp. YIM 101495]|uniref:hypothetical protein n=1 Tax=Planomicrobium sp. YIM 101495 TaxID=2665160 RepID=UPI0012B9ABD8|nr:hypothetical protein [Planomicrobium sp. YIM 101495]MTD30164.1 hypothetical protein [Planomicrobium sp. YIM 101495]
MAEFKFNRNYRDKELKREVKAEELVEMTVKRADEVVKNIKAQSATYKEYADFGYERLDKPGDPSGGEGKQDSPDGKDAPPADKEKEKQGKGE